MQKDILIIGAGPAGLSTALHLAQLAPELVPHMLVLEKAHHPRPKLCAGALVVDAEVILRHLGLDVSELPHADAEAAHFNFRGAGLVMRVPHAHGEVSHFMRMIRRDEFDAWLAGKAAGRGIEIREGVTVRSVVPDGSGVIVETDRGRFLAEVVVGADGSKGVTRRCVLPTERTHTARALEIITSYAALAEAGKTEDRQVQGQRSAQKAGHAYFDFFAVPKGIAGYVWDFPTQVRGEPRRCWGIYDANLLRQSRRPPLKEPLREEMARAGLDVESYPLQGHPIRWFSPGRAVAVARVVLVGDAAGVDGVFGEGISMALGYGQVAAHAIQDAWRRGDFSFRDYHRRLLLSPLGISLTTRWAVTHVVYRVRWAWFQHLVWRVLRGPVAAGARLLILNWAGRMSGTGTLGGSRRR